MRKPFEQKIWHPSRARLFTRFLPVVCAFASTTGYYLEAFQAAVSILLSSAFSSMRQSFFFRVALFLDLLRVSIVKAIFRALGRVQTMISNNSNIRQDIPSGGGIGKFVTRLLGCWHKEMSRPFSSQGQTYRSCLECGASRKFNVGRWEMQGDFYYRLPAWQ